MSITVTPDKQMAFTRLGALSIQATSARPITDPEWAVYLDMFLANLESEGPVIAVVQYSPKVAPNAAQRRNFAERFSAGNGALAKRAALLTESTLARGAITAISWLMRNPTTTRGFAPSDITAALQWCREVVDFPTEQAIAVLDQVVQSVGYPALR